VEGLLLEQLRAARDLGEAPVQALERRLSAARVAILQDPCHLENRVGRVAVQELVLGGEGIDARRDDGQPVRIKPLPAVSATGEDIGVGRLDIGSQEVPGRSGQLLGLVDADVAAPDDPCAKPLQGRSQPDGLRIV